MDRIEFSVHNKERNSNIELFRIILMILLVASHYIHNSGILDEIYLQPFQAKTAILAVFGMWGKPVINCFILITGYYMCKSNIRITKWIRLIVEVLFYNILIYFAFVLFGVASFSFSGLITNIIPIKTVWTDFVSCYLLFYLLIPFVNILINNMSKKQHFLLICLLGTIYIVMGTVPKITVVFNYITWFACVYLIAAYLRLYKDALVKNKKVWITAFLISYLVSVASVIAGLYVSEKTGLRLIYYLLEDSNKILAVALSLSFFTLFLNIKIKQSKIINNIAKATFGVLLIHANSDLMRQWLWKDLLKCPEYYNSNIYLLHATISVVLVYVVCIIIDLIRIKLLEEPIFGFIEKQWRLKG